MARLDAIIGNPYEKKKREAQMEMLRASKPKIWNVNMKNNAELEHTVGFEQFMFLVAQHTNEDLDKITVFRFDCLEDHIKNKNQDG